MNIKRLAISGGGYMGIALYGALKQLQIDNVYDPKNITHIYGTSAGAILSVLVALKYDWNDMDTYILERPWNKLFDVDFETIISSFGSCGIVDSHIIDDILLPFLGGRNLSSTVTFDEFKSQTGVPALFNTSFNLGGEPLVETIDDAMRTLYNSGINYLYFPKTQMLVKIEHNARA